MAKIYKKSELVFAEGYICDKDMNILEVPGGLIEKLSNLDRALQEKEYLDAQPEGTESPNLEGFKRKSMFDKIELPLMEKPETPIADAREAEALEFMKEVDEVNKVDDFNEIIRKHRDLFEFAGDDTVITCITDAFTPAPIDTPVLGNPLELTADKLLGFLEKLYR